MKKCMKTSATSSSRSLAIDSRGISGLKRDLQPHQRHALNWMIEREQETPRGGILADDMGLGKTLTAISLILTTSSTREKNCGGNLVICPLSLLKMWENEIVNCCRKGYLTVFKYHGENVTMTSDNLMNHNIVITTYNQLRKTKPGNRIYQLNWTRIILDEAHVIRNMKCGTYKAVFLLKALNKWAITATPIHKDERDFLALIKFIGCDDTGDVNFWKNIVKDKNSEDYRKLIDTLKPLMFRRTKEELIAENNLLKLPEKHVYIIEVNLEKSARVEYNKIIKQAEKAKKKKGIVKSLRLRQICCDLGLLSKKSYKNEQRSSNKVYSVMKKIKRILSENKEDKIIIVSEWSKLLKIVGFKLNKLKNVHYEMLTGKTDTSKRQVLVNRINNPRNKLNILLLTFTAGGVGLNLIGANHLFLLEVHWNPHLEAQVQDRVFRFGQQKTVHIYKFVAKNTIEENIKRQQETKLNLVTSFFGKFCHNNVNCQLTEE